MNNKDLFSSTWYLQSKTFETFAFIDNVFSDEECNTIINLGEDLEKIQALVGTEENKFIVDKTIRNNVIGFFNSNTQDHMWIYRKCVDAVNSINKQFWNFDLTYIEALQFTDYNEEGAFYGQHLDIMYNSMHHRKLSFSVMLDNENDYEGGDLILQTGNKPSMTRRNRGTVVFFPSFYLHEVSPITKGRRRSLVGWVCGPSFK